MLEVACIQEEYSQYTARKNTVKNTVLFVKCYHKFCCKYHKPKSLSVKWLVLAPKNRVYGAKTVIFSTFRVTWAALRAAKVIKMAAAPPKIPLSVDIQNRF